MKKYYCVECGKELIHEKTQVETYYDIETGEATNNYYKVMTCPKIKKFPMVFKLLSSHTRVDFESDDCKLWNRVWHSQE